MADIAHEKDDQEHNGEHYACGDEDQLSGSGAAIYLVKKEPGQADKRQHIEGE